MIKIKYNDSDIFHKVEFSRIEHIVTLKGITGQNTSGFTTYRLSGEQLGDFSEFTTVYRVGSNYVEYSNDGSVYIEPIKPTEEELAKIKLQEQIANLKHELAETDYQAIKYAEGWFTDEEYEPIKAERENLRVHIRELEAQL